MEQLPRPPLPSGLGCPDLSLRSRGALRAGADWRERPPQGRDTAPAVPPASFPLGTAGRRCASCWRCRRALCCGVHRAASLQPLHKHQPRAVWVWLDEASPRCDGASVLFAAPEQAAAWRLLRGVGGTGTRLCGFHGGLGHFSARGGGTTGAFGKGSAVMRQQDPVLCVDHAQSPAGCCRGSPPCA